VYIQSIYREWSSVSIDDEEDDEEEEDDGDADLQMPSSYAGLDYLDIPSSQGTAPADDDGLGESLGAMSISPVRPVLLR
jgi:RNA polymerase I-specific transcription initiation factor RRN3